MRQEYGVPAGPLGEYPDPADWRPMAAPPSDAEFEVKVSEKNHRIDLTHRQSEKAVRVTVAPPGCKSGDPAVRAGEERWWIDEWVMCVTFSVP